MTNPDEPGSLASIPITRHRMEVGSKQGDITLELMLAKETMPAIEIDPAVASATAGLLAFEDEDAAARSFFARCARRIREFVERRR
ncbi:MAG TPA: hypothetical protein VFA22_05630 [Stellaceae bacterium]|nr:hypothetical protein [Stellaceae bacterium]